MTHEVEWLTTRLVLGPVMASEYLTKSIFGFKSDLVRCQPGDHEMRSAQVIVQS